jgi:hypothetical protein
MHPLKLAIAAGPLAALTLAAPASAAAHTRVYDIGHCRATGTDAECTTGGGQINRPARIWLNAHASPDQKVDVYWSMDCFKGLSSSSNDGNFTARTPIKAHRLPQPGRREGTCYVTASVSLHTLGGKGSILAWLTATKR